MKLETLLKRAGAFQKVQNIANGPNQITIRCEKGTIFQSYDSIIAVRLRTDDKLYLTDKYDYSRTTSKYLNEFCGYTAGEIKKEIAEGNKDIVLLNI